MDHDNSINRETLDDDILQCRADIMKNRKRSGPSAKADHVAATGPVTDKKTVRIPAFDELVPTEKQVVDGQWETPLKVKPEIEIDPGQIVTAEEEAALFPVTETSATEHDDPHTQEYASDDGLDALREVVAQASSEARQEIEELDDTEELAPCDDQPEIIADPAESAEVEPEIEMGIESEIELELELEEELKNKTDNAEPISNAEESSDNTSMIPELNLAEKILTQQRNVASKRRQRPAAARNLNVMPIAGTVGKIIEEARKAVAESAEKNTPVAETPAATEPEKMPEKKPLVFDRIEVEKVEVVEEIEKIDKTEMVEQIEQEHQEPVLSAAACRIVNDSDRLNPFQEDIISDIVSRDIAQFCGDLENL